MSDSKEKFATFIADASHGRKVGAILSWIAAAVLLAALFMPMFKVGVVTQEELAGAESYWGKSAEELSFSNLESYVKNKASAFAALESAWNTVSAGAQDTSPYTALYHPIEHDISLIDYLVNEDRLLNDEGSTTFGIAMLALYAVLVIATILFALFTMIPLSAVCGIGAVAEVLLLYFLRVKVFMNPYSVSDFPISLSIVCIILMAVAAVFALAGVIVSLTLKGDDESEDEFSDDWSTTPGNDADAPTGLFESIMLVQLNTGKTFEVRDDKETIIGRGTGVDIVISNPIVGRTHAKVVKQGNDFVIVDLGSRNGTYVGDKRLASGGSAVLTDGEYITFGNEMFQVKVPNRTGIGL